MAIAMAFDQEAAGILEIAVTRQADPFLAAGQEAPKGADIIERRAALGADGTGTNR